VVAGWLGRFFSAPGHAVELRAIAKDGAVHAGFFDDAHLGAMAEHGLRLSQAANVKGVYVTLNPLKSEVLNRADFVNQIRKAGRGDSASAADVARRRWLLVDADPRRPANCSADDGEKAKAKAKVLQVREFLATAGWPLPLVCDSGNGYHLLYRIDLPADDGGLLKRALHALARRFDDAAVEIDRKVHDAPRITKLYGSKACKGEDTPERPHRWTGIVEVPQTVEVVPLQLLEELAGEAPAEPTSGDRHESFSIEKLKTSAARKQELARAYLAKVDPAIEGQGGDRQTFTAACHLVSDFDLTPEEALPLLREYNLRCVPPWGEEQLVHKLRKAQEKAGENPGQRGRLLRAVCGRAGGPAPTSPSAPAASTAAEPFLGTVPNFILADWEWARPRPPLRDANGKRKRGPRMIGSGLRWLVHGEIVRQKRARVCLPDVLLAQAVWGDRRSWPANWRRRLRDWLRRYVSWMNRQTVLDQAELGDGRACGPNCPLHGDGETRHGHFVLTVVEAMKSVGVREFETDPGNSLLGVLEYFGDGRGGEKVFDFARASGDDDDTDKLRQQLIDSCKKAGWLWSVYLPVLVFGPSPRSGLSPEQNNLITALTRETTRGQKSKRDDRANLVVGGQPDDAATRFAVCPFLEPGARYVAFNGNAGHRRRHLWGRGYQLIGKTGKGWLWRAAFPVPDDEKGRWKAVRTFLTELRGLTGPFGLVVAGWNLAKRRWRSLDEMIDLTRTRAGRAWLKNCRVRIYAPEDYLTRWRRYFADRMGFSVIPGDGDEGATVSEAGTDDGIASAEDLDLWMRRAGMTDQQLAVKLGVSRSYVSQQRSGRKAWSKRFRDRVATLIAAQQAELAKERTA
jgi:hypothetical protein